MKKKIILICLLMLFILVGCTTQKEVINSQYKTGTEALEMNFLKGLPPEKIFVGETFTLGINLENKGVSGITDGIIILSGYESKELSFPEGNAKKFTLEGKSQYNPKGESLPLTFQIKSNCYPNMISDFMTETPILLRATACYEYSTSSAAVVCIDTNQLSSSQTQEKMCDASKTITLSGGQGGPIEVTKIEPTMIPIENGVKARFAIYLKNANSKGLVYSSIATGTNCEDASQLNKVSVNVELSGMAMSCNVNEIQLLAGKETPIYCEKLLNTQGGVYEANIVVNSKYAYSQDALREIIVSNPPGTNKVNC